MPTKLGPEDKVLILKFGGGLHTRASEADIDDRECSEGENFILDLENMEFRRRPPFDLVGTVPNGAEIRGFITLLKSDGTVKTAVQAADTVYEWDGGSTFTSIGTVAATARLRGHLAHNWPLSDKVLITDLNLAEEVHEWDGTTFQQVSFTSDGSTAFGDFRAKYCFVDKERAWFANVQDKASNLPHLIVGSATSDYTQIDTINRPSSALSAADPFFMVQPDNSPINGMVPSFGVVILSSENGSMYTITGSTAQDFSLKPLVFRAGASGDESVVFVGNDVVFGRPGRIESVSSTERFGDVEQDDLSVQISDQLSDYKEWTLVHNLRTQRAYAFPANQQEVWVLEKPLVGSPVSPWTKFTTRHATAFMPAAVMSVLDPVDGLEYVLFGDALGNVYRMEGTGTGGDAASGSINADRLSKLYSMEADAKFFNMTGWVRYRQNEAATLTLTFESAGENVFDQVINISLPATSRPVYGGGLHYSDGNYYKSTFGGRITRETFAAAGRSNELQIRTTIDGTSTFNISEIGLRLEAAS